MSKRKIRMFTASDMYLLEGTIFKEFYKEFGEKAIPVIERICMKMGTAEGKELKAKRDLPTMDVESAAVCLGEYFRDENGESVEVEVKSPEEIHWKVDECSPGFKPNDTKVCLALMKGDEAMLNALCGGKAKLTVKKAIASGDKPCDIVITKK